MPDFDPSLNPVPPVRDRMTRPPGILPRNTQTWIIGGIALLMVVIIAFSGRNEPKDRKASNPASTPAVVDPDAVRIQEYRARIDEQSRKLAAEQTQLARTRQGLGLSPDATASPLVAPYTGQGYTAGKSAPRYGTCPGSGGDRRWIEVEKEKREYLSLFASNLALSYRRGASDAAEPPLANTDAETASALIPPYAVPYFQPPLLRGCRPGRAGRQQRVCKSHKQGLWLSNRLSPAAVPRRQARRPRAKTGRPSPKSAPIIPMSTGQQESCTGSLRVPSSRPSSRTAWTALFLGRSTAW